MRARQPDLSGSVTRDGITVGYDVYGESNSPTVVLTPTWAIAQSQHWKAQIPVLARRYRVITVEGRGNGRADRPTDPDAYTFAEHAADVLAVLDATGTERAVVAGVSRGGVIRSSVPWMTRTGQRMERRRSSVRSRSPRTGSGLNWVATSASASVSRIQPTPSSTCLVECGSGKISPQKNSPNPRRSRRQ